MFLRCGGHPLLWALAAATLGLLALPTHAQSDWQLKTHLEVGVDAWHIDHSSAVPSTRQNLFLADSEPAWNYRDLSPWYTVQSQLELGPLSHVVLRARANQGSGSVLDQLYYDHGLSPSLGFRMGVADYRATWCREYDLDNPWVRESDPFCSHRMVRKPMSSAPAVQVYLRTELGPYQLQGLMGVFRPRAFGYAPREFSGALLPEQVQITKNHKQTLSFNALEKNTSTEWRLSWVKVDQSLFDPLMGSANNPLEPSRQVDYHQTSDIVFAGVSWQVKPRWRSRITHMSRFLKSRCQARQAGNLPGCDQRVESSSTVLEWNYQPNAADVLSLALVVYPLKQENWYERKVQHTSIAWRRDWGQGAFSAIQLSHARTTLPYNLRWEQLRFQPGAASAWALGTRVGYAF